MIITKEKISFAILGFLIVSFSVLTTVPFTLNQAWNRGDYDDARDILVGKHIVEYGTIVDRGPLAAGGILSMGESKLLNSPLYYYILAFFWYISRSTTTLLLNWTLFLSIALPISAYYLGKEYKDSNLGLILATVAILNPFLSNSTIHIWQPNLAIPLIFLVFGTFFRFLRNPSITNSSLVILLSFLTIHIHYSGLLLTLPITGVVLLTYFTSSRKNTNKFKKFVPYLIFISCSTIWIGVTYSKFFGDQILFFVEMIKLVFNKQITFVDGDYSILVKKISNLTSIVTQTVLSKNNLFTMLVLSLVVIPIPEIKSIYNKKYYIHAVLLLMCAVLFTIFFDKEVYDIYLLPILILMLLRLSVFINFLLDKILTSPTKVSYSSPIIILVLFALLYMAAFPFFNTLSNRINSSSAYQENETMVRTILADSITINESDFTLAHLVGKHDYFGRDGWGTSGLWLIMEELTNKKLVEIIKPNKYEATFKPLNSGTATIVYLTCAFNDVDECVAHFLNKRTYLDSNPAEIFTSTYRTIYRFNLKSTESRNVEFDVLYDV